MIYETKHAIKEDLRGSSRIIYELINTEQNQELLAQVPHREFLDLSIVYHYLVDISDGDMHSLLIYNDMGFDEADLYDLAQENTPRLFPAKILSMDEMLSELCRLEGIDMAEIRPLLMNAPPSFVLTNTHGINGAAAVLYDGTLDTVAKALDDDLTLVPSAPSVFLALPSSSCPPEKIAGMFLSSIVSSEDEDRLSNEVYHYDRKSHKLTLATDALIKNLDEPQLCTSKPSRGHRR